MNHLLVATTNKGKLKEILRIFSAEIPELTLHTLDEFPEAVEVEESGSTFEENALLKARAGFAISGFPTLADDSGLEIDALDGRPGIHSARYSGDGDAANIAKVLEELKGVAPEKRSARFVTVVAFVDANLDANVDANVNVDANIDVRTSAGTYVGDSTMKGLATGEITVRGELEGVIVDAPRGEGGFGYDPIFQPTHTSPDLAHPNNTLTLAQLRPEEKDEISHRGRALRKIAPLVGLRFAQIQRPVE